MITRVYHRTAEVNGRKIFYREAGNASNPTGAELASAPNVVALPDGVAIKRGSEIVAGLGVGGSPGGDKDEACAAAGVSAIADQIK